MADDDFEKADVESGVVLPPIVRPTGSLPALPMDTMEYRAQLIQKYHQGAVGIVEKLRQIGKGGDAEDKTIHLIEELIRETDHLLGNELVSANNGDLRDSSVISYKRAEVLDMAIRRMQAKIDQDRGKGLDIDSPAMETIFKFFMSKAKETFDRMNVGHEIADLFFHTYGELTENWKKELRDSYQEMRQQKQGT